MKASKFNKICPKKLKKQIVDFNCFKVLNKNSSNSTDALVASISCVYRFSANDTILKVIFSKNDNNLLRNYCQNKLVKIR